MKRFFKKLFAPLKKKIKANQGFTLLEILVVLTIMGFLIAMVAPRLAGISNGAVDTVCDSNQNRMVSMMSGFFEKTNRFPNKMTNLVEETAANTYQIPSVSDDNPENGAETLAAEFMSRNHFRIYYLNDAETAELRNMGIVSLVNLNTYDAYNEAGTAHKPGYIDLINNEVALPATVTKAPTLEEVTVPTDTTATPFAVAMVGTGAASAAADPAVVTSTERNWGEPDWFGRIVLGFGPENSIITSGIVSNAAHCPGGIQNADNVTYNDYNIVLPRLEATVARFDTDADGDVDVTDAAAMGFGAGADLNALAAVSYDDAPAAGYIIATNGDNLKSRTFNIATAQERWQYATQCPEGHMFPADDATFWGIDIDADGTVD